MSSFTSLHPDVAASILTADSVAALANETDPQEGDIRYVKDVDTLYTYDGTAWAVASGSGGISPPDPATSTDNAVVRWDGVDADAVKNSVVTIDDAGVLAGASIDADTNTITNVDLQFVVDTNSTVIIDDASGTAISITNNDSTSDFLALEVTSAGAVANHVVSFAADNTSFAPLKLRNATVNGPTVVLASPSSGDIGIIAPDGATSHNLTLPGTQGATDSYLTNNGSGVLSWSDFTADAQAAVVTQTVNNGVTATSPSEDAVYDALTAKQDTSEKGNANGYASLDSGGKVPVGQLPATLMTYEGTWDASTNSPTLTNGTGDAGEVYIVSAPGTVNFGAGNITFTVGDWVIYNGTIWQKSANSDDVVSVNGFTGAVVLDYDDVNAVSEMGTVTDNRIIRSNGTTGDLIQQSGVTIDDSDQITGVTRLQVDNIAINGNAVFATSGDLELDAGVGTIAFVSPEIQLLSGCDLVLWDNDDTNAITITVPNNITSNRTPQIPDDTGNFVLTSAAQVLTLKDIDGGTASNTSRLTLPKDVKASLDALTRKEGTIVFATDDDTVYVDNGTSLVLPIRDASATVSGVVNTTTQSFAGDKTFVGATTLGSATTTTTEHLVQNIAPSAYALEVNNQSATGRGLYVYANNSSTSHNALLVEGSTGERLSVRNDGLVNIPGNLNVGGLKVGIATESGGAGTYTPDVTNLGAYVFEGTGAKTVNTINGGVDGKVLFLIQQSNAGNTLLITNAGNIRTASGSTVTITNNGGMTLVYQNGGWQEIGSGI